MKSSVRTGLFLWSYFAVNQHGENGVAQILALGVYLVKLSNKLSKE